MGGTNFEYDGKAFNARVESVQAPAIPGTLRIYSAAQRLGVRVFLLTGRPEARRAPRTLICSCGDSARGSNSSWASRMRRR